jgi:hypothetical protein
VPAGENADARGAESRCWLALTPARLESSVVEGYRWAICWGQCVGTARHLRGRRCGSCRLHLAVGGSGGGCGETNVWAVDSDEKPLAKAEALCL